MLEKDIQAIIIRWLKKRPYSVTWKQHSGRYAKAGMPDIMHVEKGHLYCFEVKLPGRGVTPLQGATLDRLEAAGASADVVFSLDDVKTFFKEDKENER